MSVPESCPFDESDSISTQKVQFLLVAIICSKCLAQQLREQSALPPPIIYKQQYRQEPVAKYPPPRILTHRQSQNHDGTFKFEYAAENGLAQSEVIAPDGTRNGGYTYIDPHGKTISVKYTAGKEGFRILQGDHIPRDSPNHVAIYQQAYSRPNYNSKDDGSYSEEKYEAPQSREQQERPQPQVQLRQYQYQPQPVLLKVQQQQPQPSLGIIQYRSQIQQPAYGPLKSGYAVQPQQRYISNEIEEDKESETQYHDAPGKPYSFGTGYSFQFNG